MSDAIRFACRAIRGAIGDSVAYAEGMCCTDTCYAPCDPPACARSIQSTDADADVYNVQCMNDCNDGNAIVNPGSSNPYCNCSQGPNGVSELTNCELIPGTLEFKPGCLCTDGVDNNCNGVFDDQDPECPSSGEIMNKSWFISVPFVLRTNKTVTGGVWVLNGGNLRIAPNVTLTINRTQGLHVAPGGWVDPDSNARIRFQ